MRDFSGERVTQRRMIVRRTLGVAVMGFAVGLMMMLVAAQASAAGCRNKISLEATPEGVEIEANGTASVRSIDQKKQQRQRFKVSMEAAVTAGTTFTVWANNLLAGTITIDELGEGDLDLRNDKGETLPAGVDPVCSIGPVEIKDADGTLLLTGSF